MAKELSNKSAKATTSAPSKKPAAERAGRGQKLRTLADSMTAPKICFTTTLHKPAVTAKTVQGAGACAGGGSGGGGGWMFLTLPKEASAKLPSRGMVSVEGTINGFGFRATLEPDGRGGHWLKVDRKMRDAAGAAGLSGFEPGDDVTLEITPLAPDQEPEPTVPPDLRKALAAAPQKAREVWSDITAAARRDFIHWITSAKQEATRSRRTETACDMLAKGKRRPCCFDRSGMYSKSLSCPVPDPGGADQE